MIFPCWGWMRDWRPAFRTWVNCISALFKTGGPYTAFWPPNPDQPTPSQATSQWWIVNSSHWWLLQEAFRDAPFGGTEQDLHLCRCLRLASCQKSQPFDGVKNVHFNQHILVYPSNVYCILTLATCNCCIWWLYTSKYSNFQVHCLGGYCQAVLAGLWTQFPWKVQLVSLGIAKIKSTVTGRYR